MGFLKTSCIFFLIMSCSLIYSLGDSSNVSSVDSLDLLLRDFAFKALVRPRTGVLYKPHVPANLSGAEIAIVRLRSGSFWSRGANFSSFETPPRTTLNPYSRRLALVYENLGNWSSVYFNVSGYSLATPVVGLLAYDASNLRANNIQELNLIATQDPISIRFSGIALPKGSDSTARCVRFGRGGTVYFSNVTLQNVCTTRNQGHFALVVPAIATSPSPGIFPLPWPKRRGKVKVWGIAVGVVFLGLVLLGLVGISLLRFVRKKRILRMENQAEEDETLESVHVGNSKMPAAALTRTQPMIENGNAP